MNDPPVGVSPEDAAAVFRTLHAVDLVREAITRPPPWAAPRQRAAARRAVLLTGFAWLVIAVIVLRFTVASVTTDALAVLAAVVAGFLIHDLAGRSPAAG
jgi:hypothetical protein